jgi:hypothetical protein
MYDNAMHVKVHELIARLEADGWFLVRQKVAIASIITRETRNSHRRQQVERRYSARHFEQHSQAGRFKEVRSHMRYLVVIEQDPTSFWSIRARPSRLRSSRQYAGRGNHPYS